MLSADLLEFHRAAILCAPQAGARGLSVVPSIVEHMSETVDVDLIGGQVDAIATVPLEDLSDAELRSQADRLRAFEAVLRQRMRAEVARRASLARRSRASRQCRQPRAG
jgi:hypothetical protein